MNARRFGGLLLLLSAIGCAPVSPPQTPASLEPSQPSAAEAPASPTPAEPSLAPSPSAPAASSPLSQAEATPAIQRDFAPTTPLPETGQVTARGSIRDLEADRMIAQCPADSAPFAFAESTNYLVQICSAEYDPWLPKYYMSRAKDGSGTIELTNDNPDTARQLIFTNGDYTYALDRDGDRPAQTNAYLEVQTPDGITHAEALLYFYEQSAAPVAP